MSQAAKKAAAAASTDAAKPFVKRGASSLYAIAVRRKDLAVGLRLRRALWNRESDADTYVVPVHINTWFTATGKPRGQAYGVYWFRGVREDVVRPIRSAHKKEWYVAEERADQADVAKKLAAELHFVAPAYVPKSHNVTSAAQ